VHAPFVEIMEEEIILTGLVGHAAIGALIIHGALLRVWVSFLLIGATL